MTERWEKLAECRAAFVTDELAYYGWEHFEEFDEKPTEEDLKSPDYTLWTEELQEDWSREVYRDIWYNDLRRRLGLSKALRALVPKVKNRTNDLLKKRSWRGAFMCSGIAYWTLAGSASRMFWNDECCWDYSHEDSLTVQTNGYPMSDAMEEVHDLWQSVLDNMPEESLRRTEGKVFELVSSRIPDDMRAELFQRQWSRRQAIRMHRCQEADLAGVSPSMMNCYGPIRMRGRRKTETEESVLQERIQKTKEWLKKNEDYLDTKEYWTELKEFVLRASWATEEDVAFLIENTPPQELKNTLEEILTSPNWSSREEELWTLLSERTWEEAREKGVPVPELGQVANGAKSAGTPVQAE